MCGGMNCIYTGHDGGCRFVGQSEEAVPEDAACRAEAERKIREIVDRGEELLTEARDQAVGRIASGNVRSLEESGLRVAPAGMVETLLNRVRELEVEVFARPAVKCLMCGKSGKDVAWFHVCEVRRDEARPELVTHRIVRCDTCHKALDGLYDDLVEMEKDQAETEDYNTRFDFDDDLTALRDQIEDFEREEFRLAALGEAK